jgi:hypothetical protein
MTCSSHILNRRQQVEPPGYSSGISQDGSKGALLVVSGEVRAIDEGNKVKRVMIGLGRGGSEVQTHVVISSVVDGRSTVVLELNLKSVSGKKLGAVESVGGGSIALNAAEGDVGDRHSTVQADATRMAKGVAKQIEQFVAAQHPASSPAVTPVAALPPSAPPVLQHAELRWPWHQHWQFDLWRGYADTGQ